MSAAERLRPQLDLFSTVMLAATGTDPAPAANDTQPVAKVSAPTWVKDGVVHVHLADGSTYSDPLPTGPLTRGECSEWTVPCNVGCRFRLDDLIERRTRRVEEEFTDSDDVDLLDLEGPLDARGAFYSDTPMSPGIWCALTVADEGGDGKGREIDDNVSLAELGDYIGVTREAARIDVEEALESMDFSDADMGRRDEGGSRLRSLYGDRGSVKKRVIELEEEIDPASLKSAVKAAKEPRSVPSVKRRSKVNVWAGITRVIPVEFLSRVDLKLMDQMGGGAAATPEWMKKPLTPPGRRGSKS